MSKDLSPVTKSDLPPSRPEWVGSDKCAEAPPALHPTNPLSSTGKEGPWMNRDSGQEKRGPSHHPPRLRPSGRPCTPQGV